MGGDQSSSVFNPWLKVFLVFILVNMKSVDLDDVRLSVEDRGEGRPLLFVHGFPLDHSMWQAQIEEFSQLGYRTIAPDLRGFGQSELGAGPVTMERYADDLYRLLDRLGVTKPVVYCGLSMGGYGTWALIEGNPKLFAAAVPMSGGDDTSKAASIA